ncbi:MFS transporter [Amycolatopsis acidicola]|uniref:MFS transporter n=1 Tax=Amycolatopsis acidicola TaxID=2596893 RepID=UPI001FB66B4A|nr:MFS transporter [Amycolatopsis acidicola]
MPRPPPPSARPSILCSGSATPAGAGPRRGHCRNPSASRERSTLSDERDGPRVDRAGRWSISTEDATPPATARAARRGRGARDERLVLGIGRDSGVAGRVVAVERRRDPADGHGAGGVRGRCGGLGRAEPGRPVPPAGDHGLRRVPRRGGAFLAAAANAAFPLCGETKWLGVGLRFLTGFALAAVYPVGMKVVVSWFPRGRGLALGVLLAALTVGSAMPNLLTVLSWRPVLFGTAAFAVVSGVLAIVGVRPGPEFPPSSSWEPRYVLRILADRRQRLVFLGYFGHMWEMYALWAWLPAYLGPGSGPRSFVVIGICGTFGCLAGGALSDRHGRPLVAMIAMLVSGVCCLLSAAAFGTVALVPLLLVWGAAVVADSGQFSAALSELTDQRYVGTALTAMTACGFLISGLTIQLLPLLADAVGWRQAVPLLAAGPLVGTLAMHRLRAHQNTARLAI